MDAVRTGHGEPEPARLCRGRAQPAGPGSTALGFQFSARRLPGHLRHGSQTPHHQPVEQFTGPEITASRTGPARQAQPVPPRPRRECRRTGCENRVVRTGIPHAVGGSRGIRSQRRVKDHPGTLRDRQHRHADVRGTVPAGSPAGGTRRPRGAALPQPVINGFRLPDLGPAQQSQDGADQQLCRQ